MLFVAIKIFMLLFFQKSKCCVQCAQRQFVNYKRKNRCVVMYFVFSIRIFSVLFSGEFVRDDIRISQTSIQFRNKL